MDGIRRLLTFCMLIAILPTMLIVIPLYLRHVSYADVAYAVTESDIIEVNDGISTIFCSEHTLQMNGTFNAFQMAQRPEVTSKRKHIRLKKSMNLPDDTLEYWGFYLLKDAVVSLSVCSRFQGASILVVKGERNLHTCGLLEHNVNKEQTQDIFLPGANRQVKIIYESNAQEIDSKEATTIESINIYNTSNIHKPLVNISSGNPLKRDSKVFTSTNNSTLAFTTDETSMKDLELLYDTATSYVQKHIDDRQENAHATRKLRHKRYQMKNKNKRTRQGRKHIQDYDKQMRIQKLEQELHSYSSIEKDVIEKETKIKNTNTQRFKRSRELIKPPSLLDQGIKHGGNADKNFTSDSKQASSLSSFQTDLVNCYGGAILLTHEFEPSDQCTNIFYLLSGKHAQTNHRADQNGYYYYIFYSDNDVVSNDIYAIFDIYKPTFQYENVTKSCINETACSFSLSPLSMDRVIVEIPTKDGIEHDEANDINMLISICQPRMGAYIIFPIAILFVILVCAFI